MFKIQFSFFRYAVVSLFFLMIVIAGVPTASCSTCTIKVIDGEEGKDAHVRVAGTASYEAYLDEKMQLTVFTKKGGRVSSTLNIVNPYGKVAFLGEFEGTDFSCQAGELENGGTIKSTSSSQLNLSSHFTNNGSGRANFNNLKIEQTINIINNIGGQLEFSDSTFDCDVFQNLGNIGVRNTHVKYNKILGDGKFTAHDSLIVRHYGDAIPLNLDVKGNLTFKLGDDVDRRTLLSGDIRFTGKMFIDGRTFSSLDQVRRSYFAYEDSSDNVSIALSSSEESSEELPERKSRLPTRGYPTDDESSDWSIDGSSTFQTTGQCYQDLAGPQTSDSIAEFITNPSLKKLHAILCNVCDDCYDYDENEDEFMDRLRPFGYISRSNGEFYMIQFLYDLPDEDSESCDDSNHYNPGLNTLSHFQTLLSEFLYPNEKNINDINNIRFTLKSKTDVHTIFRLEFNSDKYINVEISKSHPFIFRDVSHNVWEKVSELFDEALENNKSEHQFKCDVRIAPDEFHQHKYNVNLNYQCVLSVDLDCIDRIESIECYDFRNISYDRKKDNAYIYNLIFKDKKLFLSKRPENRPFEIHPATLTMEPVGFPGLK